MGKMALRVLATLKRNGKYVKLRPFATVGGEYNPGTGHGTPAGSTGTNDMVRVAVLLDMMTNRLLSGFGSAELVNTNIAGVKKWALMDAVGVDPKAQDKVIDGSIMYDIINIQTASNKEGPAVHILAMSY